MLENNGFETDLGVSAWVFGFGRLGSGVYAWVEMGNRALH